MLRNRAYKVEIDPNNRQRTALLRHAGCARWAYNWGLKQKIEAYKATGKSPNYFELHRDFVKLKKTDESEGGVPWMYEVSKCAPQEALRNLDRAFANFFRRCKQKASKKGFPRFKSRRRGIGSFRLTGSIKVNDTGTHVILPRLGALKLKERGYLPGPERDGVKVLSATVSERAGRWFISLQVEQTMKPKPKAHGQVIGVDVGVNHLAVLSDGTKYDNPRALKKGQERLRRAQKSVSRKVKGSNNRRKAVQRLARLHYRVACVRRDALHKMTTDIIRRCGGGMICIEDLNVKGMQKNRRLARAVSDAALAEMRRQLEYKAAWSGVQVKKADRWFPSSKTCSGCGVVKDYLDLSERTFRCGSCGLVLDRDWNAALNLKNLAGSSLVTACGDGVRPSSLNLKALSMKQEPNRVRIVTQVSENG